MYDAERQEAIGQARGALRRQKSILTGECSAEELNRELSNRNKDCHVLGCSETGSFLWKSFGISVERAPRFWAEFLCIDRCEEGNTTKNLFPTSCSQRNFIIRSKNRVWGFVSGTCVASQNPRAGSTAQSFPSRCLPETSAFVCMMCGQVLFVSDNVKAEPQAKECQSLAAGRISLPSLVPSREEPICRRATSFPPTETRPRRSCFCQRSLRGFDGWR